MVFYDLMKLFLPIFLRFFFRCEVRGTEHIPEEGGVIVAANHISNWDPPVVAAFAPRYIRYMAKEELFRLPVFGGLCRKLGAFPVRRGASDRAAIRRALQILEEGGCLGVFPEGTRSKDGKLGSPEAGLALIAVKADVPVVPTAVIGTNRIFADGSFFPKLKILYGEPIRFEGEHSDRAAMQEFSQEIMRRIEILLRSGQSA